MSITSALNSATSGLSVSARLADTISNNVANALTEGYGRRHDRGDLAHRSAATASGARVTATTRAESAFLTATRRTADAAVGATAGALGRLRPDDDGDGRARRRQRPLDARDRARDGADGGDRLAAVDGEARRRRSRRPRPSPTALNRIAEENVALRSEADAEIARQVDTVNGALGAIDDINRKIGVMATAGARHHRPPGRAQPARSTASRRSSRSRPSGATTARWRSTRQNGGVLLDGKVYALSFTAAANVVTAGPRRSAPASRACRRTRAPRPGRRR